MMKTLKIGTYLVLLWIPRIIWKTILAFLAHLLPTVLMIFILYLSWKRAWIGGIVFILAGIAYMVWQGVKYPVIFIPLFLVGLLFLLSWFFRKEIEEAQASYEER
jgi:uncharacterized membrane protein